MAMWQLQPKVGQTVQLHVSYEFIWIRNTCDYIQLNVHYCVLLSSRVRVRVRVRIRVRNVIKFSVWLASCYAHVGPICATLGRNCHWPHINHFLTSLLSFADKALCQRPQRVSSAEIYMPSRAACVRSALFRASGTGSAVSFDKAPRWHQYQSCSTERTVMDPRSASHRPHISTTTVCTAAVARMPSSARVGGLVVLQCQPKAVQIRVHDH